VHRGDFADQAGTRRGAAQQRHAGDERADRSARRDVYRHGAFAGFAADLSGDPIMANFTMFAGDTKVLVVSVADEKGAAVDITGTVIRWQLAKSVTSTALILKSVGAGVTIIDGPSGRFDVALDA